MTKLCFLYGIYGYYGKFLGLLMWCSCHNCSHSAQGWWITWVRVWLTPPHPPWECKRPQCIPDGMGIWTKMLPDSYWGWHVQRNGHCSVVGSKYCILCLCGGLIHSMTESHFGISDTRSHCSRCLCHSHIICPMWATLLSRCWNRYRSPLTSWLWLLWTLTGNKACMAWYYCWPCCN